MKRRDFIKNTGLIMAAAPFMNFTVGASGNNTGKRMIVLGFDGMDPMVVNRLMQKGELPNMQKLAQMGTFTMMRTTTPPQSPVAWGSFITGSDPGVYGIYDFLHRDPKNYTPIFSQTETIPGKNLELGKYRIPWKASKINLQREGKPFWDYLEERDVDATIFKIPSNFPPSKSKQRTLAGMGTPSLRDGYGMYTIYTSDEEESMKDISPHYNYYAYINDDNVMEGTIEGPANDMVEDENNPKPIVPFKVYLDYKNKTVRIDIQGKEILLAEKEYSQWVEIDFDLIPNVIDVKGMVKFFLLDLSKEKFRLYISPVHLSPANPATPISTPSSYSEELAEECGLYHTISLPADTQALSKNTFSMENFIVQSDSVLTESKKMFRYEFERFLGQKSGLLFFYFSSMDQGQHMFWSLNDPAHPYYHPEESKRFGHVVDDLYREHDRVLGQVLKEAPKDVQIIAMSDHGFAPFHREFHLNTWLWKEGYLKLDVDEIDDEVSLLEYGHWGDTKAYGIGLNGLYVNLKDRERDGIVTAGEKRKLLEELKGKLEALKDPKTGANVVSKAYISEDEFSRDYIDRAPDIIVGCNKGYRIAGTSAIGGMKTEIITDNMDWWAGDHCMNPIHVPATFISNFKINKKVPNLSDMAPTILKYFGINNPPTMSGKSLI